MCKMCKISKLVVVLAVLCLGLAPVAQAANVVLVGEGVTDPDPVIEWVEWLEAEGHNVDYRPDYWVADGNLDAGRIAELEAADLIIVNNRAGSGDAKYPPAQWNAITTPILVQNSYFSRSNRWKWFPSTSDGTHTDPVVQAVVPEHPVFLGVTLDANSELQATYSVTRFARTLNVGNGTLIARDVDGAFTSIAEWEPGVEFYDGAGQFAGGKRMAFFAGSYDPVTSVGGVWNLTAAGEKMFRNAINYLLGVWASGPAPADGAVNVPRDVVLSWAPGAFAATHDVYFGTIFGDVNDASRGNPLDVFLSQGQDANSYDPAGLLDFGQVYYWRVDGVAAAPDDTIFRGNVWCFTTEPFGYPIGNVTATSNAVSEEGVGPERTIDGSGLDAADQHSAATVDMWLGTPSDGQPIWLQYEFDRVYKLYGMRVWNYNAESESFLGFGLKDVTVEYSENGTDWTTLRDEVFTQGPGQDGYAYNTTVDFGGVTAQYVRLNVNSNWGTMGRYGLSEVRFLYIPTCAREPVPTDGAVDVSLDMVLSWRAGREAALHEVYFSGDQQGVIDGTALVDTTSETSYAVSSLDLGTTYYWKVDEVNQAEAISTWAGDIWSFTTIAFTVIDDFESYTDDSGKEVFAAWIDGYGVDTNGSQVGHEAPPYAEESIVHSGRQSMPLYYDNTGDATDSEAVLTLDTAQDWTEAGAEHLVLYFSGDSDNAVGQLYLSINGSRVDYDGSTAVLQTAAWTQWDIDLATLGAAARNTTTVTLGVSGSGTGVLYIDDIRLYRVAPVVE